MNQNFLSLNTDKTEVIVFNPKRKLSPAGNLSIQVGGSCFKPSLNVRNLGAIFDTHRDMEHHVNAVSRTCKTEIRNCGVIYYNLINYDQDICLFRLLFKYETITNTNSSTSCSDRGQAKDQRQSTLHTHSLLYRISNIAQHSWILHQPCKLTLTTIQ